MKLLVIGGTRFAGRHIVETAISAGHDVTLFNRGISGRELFPGVEWLEGDRDGGLDVLGERRWDAAIDTPGYIPRVVRESAQLLSDAVDRYVFISSLSAYASFRKRGMTEDAPLARLADESVETVDNDTYGGLKALCEAEVERAFPGRSVIIRAGMIVGPHDHTGRWSYWLMRVARGGEMAALGAPTDPIQFIDARDLAAWAVRMAQEGPTGPFNATGPDAPLSWGRFIETCIGVTGAETAITWLPDAFLAQHKVVEDGAFPFWAPASTMPGLYSVDTSRALAAGLTFRPLQTTIADTLHWCREGGFVHPGPGAKAECDLLMEYRLEANDA